MKGSLKWTATMCLCMLLLTGCGTANVPNEIMKTTISIRENGQIVYWLAGDFDKDYYDIAELNQMAVEEAEKYSAERITEIKTASDEEKQYPVTVNSVKASPNNPETVLVQYSFDGWETYTEFNKEKLFYGTVAEAKQQGYHIETEFIGVKDNTVYLPEDIGNFAERHIVITSTGADIYCPATITHVSRGVLINEGKSANTFGVEGLAYILLK